MITQPTPCESFNPGGLVQNETGRSTLKHENEWMLAFIKKQLQRYEDSVTSLGCFTGFHYVSLVEP